MYTFWAPSFVLIPLIVGLCLRIDKKIEVSFSSPFLEGSFSTCVFFVCCRTHHTVQLAVQWQGSRFCSFSGERVFSDLMLLQILNAGLAHLLRNAALGVEMENPDSPSLSCAFPCSRTDLVTHLGLWPYLISPAAEWLAEQSSDQETCLWKFEAFWQESQCSCNLGYTLRCMFKQHYLSSLLLDSRCFICVEGSFHLPSIRCCFTQLGLFPSWSSCPSLFNTLTDSCTQVCCAEVPLGSKTVSMSETLAITEEAPKKDWYPSHSLQFQVYCMASKLL